MSAENTEE